MKVTLKVPSPSSKPWTVKGADLKAVFDNLNKHGWWGRYRANESYKGKPDKSGNIVTVALSAKPVVHMLKWAGYGKAKPAEKKSWDAMWKALETHEKNHHKIFSDAAAAWKKALEAGGDLSKSDMAAAWKKFTTDTQKQQDDYDKRSKHGANEGVILVIP